MELNERRFWHALRETLARAESEERAELEDAERMLAETEPEPGSQFSDERIDEVVRLVTAAESFDEPEAGTATADDGQRFWAALRQTLQRAEAEEAEELAAAERMLAETPAEPAAQFSDARIAEVVRLVTAADCAVAGASAEEEVVDDVLRTVSRGPRAVPPLVVAPEPEIDRQREVPREREVARERAAEPAPARSFAVARATWRQRLAKLPRPLAAAAMIMLTPQFLAPMGVVAVVIVASQLMQRTTDTLPFEATVRTMTDAERPEDQRIAALHLAASDVLTSVRIIQGVAIESSVLGTDAQQALCDLRQAVSSSPAFSARSFSEAHTQLGDVLADATQDQTLRSSALQSLGIQLRYAIAGLKSLETSSSAQLALHAVLAIEKLQQRLAQ